MAFCQNCVANYNDIPTKSCSAGNYEALTRGEPEDAATNPLGFHDVIMHNMYNNMYKCVIDVWVV